MVKRRNLNGKSKGKTTNKPAASNMGNILKWLNPEEPPREKKKKTMDNTECRQTRSKAKHETASNGKITADSKASDIEASSENTNSSADEACGSSSSNPAGSAKPDTPKTAPATDECKTSEDTPILDEQTSQNRKKRDHDISPSPDSPAARSGYETGDTEKYDSWSDEESQETRYWKNDETTAKPFTRSKVDRTKELKRQLKLVSRWSQQDTKAYREGYPGKEDSTQQRDNYLFYTNQIPSRPDGGKIEEILETWKGEYVRLERHHGYIQWLFPIRERGMNWVSQELQTHEMEDIKKDKEASERFMKSYELMLDFYGLRIKNRETGTLERAENWEDRLSHLNKSFHNYLRITRILKSLGELGYEHMKKPFVEFLLEEAIERQTIPNAAKSCVEYWIHTLRSQEERKELIGKVKVFIESE